MRGLLYGGSVTPGNAADFLGIPEVDGVFAGRSAWTAAGFLALIRVAAASP